MAPHTAVAYEMFDTHGQAVKWAERAGVVPYAFGWGIDQYKNNAWHRKY